MRRAVEDVMTRDVVVAQDSMTFKQAARLMDAAGVSALPVVDADGRVVGMVSEADLLLKEEGAGAGKHHPALAVGRRRGERKKAEGLAVRDLMTSPAITIGPKEPLSAAAHVMHARDVKRLPVVDDAGKLVGIVSRHDLLKIFLRPDADIRDDVVHDVIERTLWLDPRTVRVEVVHGIVMLEGRLENRSLVGFLIGLVRGVDGVVGVESRLSFEIDDTRMHSEGPLPWGVLAGLRYRADEPRERRSS